MVTRATDLMTREVVTVAPSDSVANVAATLSGHRISAAPVCGPDGKLVGMISEGDLIAPFRESRRLKRDWWLGVLSEGTDLAQSFLDYLRQDTRTAAELMTRRLVTADDSATLSEIAELMISRGVKRIPIVLDDKPIGIVSRADVVTALARTPSMLV
jgi:CBS domain-containing protein